MGDLISEVLSLSAAVSANEAAIESRKAAAAANERTESGVNPFIVFESRKLEDIEVPGTRLLGIFYGETKKKISDKFKKVCVKKTDIAFLEENEDDYGTKCVIVHLEERCLLNVEFICVLGTIESAQEIINKQ